MKIYTKTGDEGTTGLYGGGRVPKDSPRIRAIGEVDELNAQIGVVRSLEPILELEPTLSKVQSWLFDLGAELASPPGSKNDFIGVFPHQSEELETSMDRQHESLEPLKQFILPGGTQVAAQLHVARCVCRRAERAVLALHAQEDVRGDLRVFLNRLSDWLFVSARTANAVRNVQDVPWQKAKE